MDSTVLTILGIGDPRCGMPAIGSLANYFGERPLEVRLYDCDAELLEMYDRLARIAFKYAKSPHRLVSTEDPVEALEQADRVVYQMGERSTVKFAKQFGKAHDLPASAAQFACDELLGKVPAGAKVLSLASGDLTYPMGVFRLSGWPAAIADEWVPLVLHEVHRFILDEEPTFKLLQANERTPLIAWLDDPQTAEFVSKASPY